MTMTRTHILASLVLLVAACANSPAPVPSTAGLQGEARADPAKDLSRFSKAYFASGCFWCVEGVYESVRGVEEAVSGYAGGTKENPTYEEVGTGRTGHAETVEVYYDPAVVSFATLVQVFFDSHDPTVLNGQGPDDGSQYRSIAFFQTPEEESAIRRAIADIEEAKTFSRPVVTEVVPFKKFWPAEEYHQNYVQQNPGAGYVRNVSMPRIEDFKAKQPELLK
ncbi:MAG: peptide-methionine (S)-S-oxide reductase MsrA [Flavobacteriales bacterium]|nr:MAG: peptide-methionine (S)-S-oxide reductase MsrA [Flavobacteriales bacterium]